MNLFRTLITSLLFPVSIFSASAVDFLSTEQSEHLFNIGARAGINTSNRTVGAIPTPGYNRQSWGTGFDAGVVIDLNIRDYIAIQPGIFFDSRSGDYTFVTAEQTGADISRLTQAGHHRSYNLQIPVIASLRFNLSDAIRWEVDLGPYISFLLDSKMEDKAIAAEGNPTIEPFAGKASSTDFGIKVGTGLQIARHYYVGVHYVAGCVKAWKNLDLSNNMNFIYGGRIKSWMFTIGYDF